jgi:hypothetical protein
MTIRQVRDSFLLRDQRFTHKFADWAVFDRARCSLAMCLQGQVRKDEAAERTSAAAAVASALKREWVMLVSSNRQCH